MCGPIVFSLISNSHWEVIEYCLQIKKGVKEKEAFPFFSTYLFRFTYLHTPWYLPAGQSPRGTYQSSALCVGKNPICTWCRSLYWSRTRSSLSCTLEGEAKKEGESSASLSSGADRELRGFGERGRPWRNYTVSHKKKKKSIMLCDSFLYGALVYIIGLVFPDINVFSPSCSCCAVSEQTVWKRSSRAGEELCHADLFQQDELTSSTWAHMFSTNARAETGRTHPAGALNLWVLNMLSYHFTRFRSACVSIAKDHSELGFSLNGE